MLSEVSPGVLRARTLGGDTGQSLADARPPPPRWVPHYPLSEMPLPRVPAGRAQISAAHTWPAGAVQSGSVGALARLACAPDSVPSASVPTCCCPEPPLGKPGTSAWTHRSSGAASQVPGRSPRGGLSRLVAGPRDSAEVCRDRAGLGGSRRGSEARCWLPPC